MNWYQSILLTALSLTILGCNSDDSLADREKSLDKAVRQVHDNLQSH